MSGILDLLDGPLGQQFTQQTTHITSPFVTTVPSRRQSKGIFDIVGRVGNLEVNYHQDMKLGEVYPEIGFITQSALNNGGVDIENTGSEALVLTFDFPQNAHSKTPGVAS